MTSGASRKIDGAKQRLAQQKRWSSLLSTIAELSKLAEQMATNLTLAETNAQQAIEARNVEMKRVSALRVDFEQERKLKDEAMKGKSELEADLKVGLGLIHQLTNDVVAIRKNAEKALLDKSMDMEQMNKLVEQLEDENSDLKKKNKQLISDMQNAQAQFQSDEIKAVQNEADSLAGHVEKEVPRQDALEGKEGIESMLQMEPVTGVVHLLARTAAALLKSTFIWTRSMVHIIGSEPMLMVVQSLRKKELGKVKRYNSGLASIPAVIGTSVCTAEIILVHL